MYPTSSCSARLWHVVGYKNGYHICLSSDASSIHALGSLRDISKKENLNFCILTRTVCEASQKATADLGMARNSLRQQTHFNKKAGYLQSLHASRAQ